MAKILIVEDDPFLLKMYQKKFQVQGYDVVTASDGLAGLDKIRKEKPDIVLMDIMMPKLSGLEALARAKADDSISDIPILILTNLSSSDDSHVALKKGAVGYIVKSDVTPSQVVSKVEAILKKAES